MDITVESPDRPVSNDHVIAGIPGAGQTLDLDTAIFSTLGWERETRVIRHGNEACHLRTMDPTP